MMMIEPEPELPDTQFRFYLPRKVAFMKNATLKITVNNRCWLTKWSLSCQGIKLNECSTRFECQPNTTIYYPLMLWYDKEPNGLVLFSSSNMQRQYYFDVEISPRDCVETMQLLSLVTPTTLEHIVDLEKSAEQQLDQYIYESFSKFAKRRD